MTGRRIQYSRNPDPEFSGLPESVWRRIEPTGFCWNWTGETLRGYGRTKQLNGTKIVHRVVYEALVGPIAEGLHLDHLCRNTRCCNPDHLEPVDAAENSHRSWSPCGQNYRKTHCAQGHEYTPENTALVGGWRKCRECQRRWTREYKERQRNVS